MPRRKRLELTAVEREILQHVADGSSDKVISVKLRMSKPRVSYYVRACCTKLKALSRVHAVAIAIRKGLLK